MNRILFLSSILILVLILAGTGCRESSVVPYDDNSVNIKKLIERTWIFDSGSNGNDTSKTRNGWIIDIKSDGTYSTSSPNSSSTSGRWTYSASDSVIILRPNDGSNSTNLKIDSVSESLIDLRNTNDNEIIKMRSQVGPLFSISGNLLFEKNITIPRTRQVSVIWKSTGSDNRSFVWGHGKVDELNGSYKIDFNTYPPDSLIARFYGCKGKIGIGTIFLHSDPRLIIDGTSMEGSVPQNCIGIVKDRALVFLFGLFDGTQCSADFPWINAFSRGYTMGQASYANGQKDKYTPLSVRTGDLIISDAPSTFVTPVWW